MLREKTPKQLQYELVFLENLVPQDHLLRKIDKYIDFSFITEKTKHLYCENNSRPASGFLLFRRVLQDCPAG